MITNIPGTVAFSDWVSSEGTKDIGDGSHFDSESQRLLGNRYAEKMMNLVYNADPAKEKVEEAVALFIGSPKAVVRNAYTLVDITKDKVMPVVKNDRTLVPVRFISESFGAQVGWDDATRTVEVKLGDTTVKMVLGSNIMNVNGKEVTLEVPAESIEGRTFIPLGAFSEALGKKVFWDDRGLIVISNEEILDSTANRKLIDDLVNLF